MRGVALSGHGKGLDVVVEPAPAGSPFMEQWAIVPAIRHLAEAEGPIATLGDGPAGETAELPLRGPDLSVPGFGSIWAVWTHIHCFDPTPATGEDTDALLGRLVGDVERRGARLLRWTQLPTDTPFFERLERFLKRRGLSHRITRAVARPVLHAGVPGAAEALNERIGTKRLREFRRCRRRLEERGRLEFRVQEGRHDASGWIRDFLRIEASGWKGKERTAIACRPDERAYFEAMCHAAAAQGRALVYSLELDGRAIAITVNFRKGRGVWCFKTAYLDDLARFAPGALLEYEASVAACEDPGIDWVDSCSSDDSGLMGQLWDGRRPIVDIVFATRPSSNIAVRLFAATLQFCRAVRGKLQRVRAAAISLFRSVFYRPGSAYGLLAAIAGV